MIVVYCEFFGWILLNSKLICVTYCSNLFRNLRKESEFRQYHCRNSTKVGERKRKSGREKFLIFGNTITEIPFANTCCPSGCSKCECAQKENQMGQWYCRNRKKKNGNCGNAIAENGRKKNSGWRNHMWGIKKKKSVMSTIFLQHFHNKSQVISYY